MLEFIGRGSAFNWKDGNNSSFYKEENKMILIDCGEVIFSKILELDLLKNVEEIDVFITHTHSDHIGSLGSLIYYFYYVKRTKVNIIIDDFSKHIDSINQILLLSGVKTDMYNIITTERIVERYDTIKHIQYVPTTHYDGLDSYGLYLKVLNKTIYYSGDTNDFELIKKMLNNPEIDIFYIEVTLSDFKNNPHMAFKKLLSIISDDNKHKIRCMHIDGNECENELEKANLQVVKVYKKCNKKDN